MLGTSEVNFGGKTLYMMLREVRQRIEIFVVILKMEKTPSDSQINMVLLTELLIREYWMIIRDNFC